MKLLKTLLFLLLLAVLSCEKDDICLEAITPNLIIRFYDNDSPSDLKEIKLDSVWITGSIAIDDYKSVLTDSIAIPLDLNNNKTTYIIENNQVKDTIEFSYDRNDIYVSRSCGYKSVFENLQINNSTNNWIKNNVINNNSVLDETAAHISIFY